MPTLSYEFVERPTSMYLVYSNCVLSRTIDPHLDKQIEESLSFCVDLMKNGELLVALFNVHALNQLLKIP